MDNTEIAPHIAELEYISPKVIHKAREKYEQEIRTKGYLSGAPTLTRWVDIVRQAENPEIMSEEELQAYHTICGLLLIVYDKIDRTHAAAAKIALTNLKNCLHISHPLTTTLSIIVDQLK